MRINDNSVTKYNVSDFSSECIFGNIIILSIDRFNANLEIAVPFKEYMLGQINDGRSKFIIDFSEVNYLDSTFLGSLVLILKKLKSVDGKVKLVFRKKSEITAMFDLTNMSAIFEIYYSLEDAKHDFAYI